MHKPNGGKHDLLIFLLHLFLTLLSCIYLMLISNCVMFFFFLKVIKKDFLTFHFFKIGLASLFLTAIESLPSFHAQCKSRYQLNVLLVKC